MWELDCEESWVPKNWCFWTVVLKTLESPLDCKEIQLVHPKGDQSWVFIGRTDAEAETPVLWPPHAKCWLIGKDSDAGREWGQEEKGTTEDEMVEWHHWLDGHEFEWTQGVGDGQEGLACWVSWGHKESDTTEQLNWTELNKGMKYLWINLIKEVKELYTESYNTLMKETEGHSYKWKDILCSQMRILLKCPHYPKQTTDSMKSLSKSKGTFTETEQS